MKQRAWIVHANAFTRSQLLSTKLVDLLGKTQQREMSKSL